MAGATLDTKLNGMILRTIITVTHIESETTKLAIAIPVYPNPATNNIVANQVKTIQRTMSFRVVPTRPVASRKFIKILDIADIATPASRK